MMRKWLLVHGGGSSYFRFAFVVLKMRFLKLRGDAWASSLAGDKDYIS